MPDEPAPDPDGWDPDPEGWDVASATWDDDPYVKAYAAAAFDSLRARLAAHAPGLLGPDARVLDFGCGTGLLAERLAPCCGQVVAVDVSVGMIAQLRRKRELPDTSAALANVLPLRADLLAAEAVDFSGDEAAAEALAAPFDLVVCSSVLSFVPDYAEAVGALVARLRPGGLLLHWDWARAEGAKAEPGALDREEVRAGLAAAGGGAALEVLEVEEFFCVSAGEGDEQVEMRPLLGVARRR